MINRRDFVKTVAAGVISEVAISQVTEDVISSVFGSHIGHAVARADVPNGNNRVYSRELLEGVCRDFSEKYSNRSLLGECSVSCGSVIRLSEVSHIVTDLRMAGDLLVASIECLKTPNGRVLNQLLQEKNSVAFRLHGIGYHEIGEDGIHTIRDYKMISIHAYPANMATSI